MNSVIVFEIENYARMRLKYLLIYIGTCNITFSSRFCVLFERFLWNYNGLGRIFNVLHRKLAVE